MKNSISLLIFSMLALVASNSYAARGSANMDYLQTKPGIRADNYRVNIIEDSAHDWKTGWTNWKDPSYKVYQFAIADNKTRTFQYTTKKGVKYWLNYSFFHSPNRPAIWYQIVRENDLGAIQEGWTTLTDLKDPLTSITQNGKTWSTTVLQMKFDVPFLQFTDMKPYLYLYYDDTKGETRGWISAKPNDFQAKSQFAVMAGVINPNPK